MELNDRSGDDIDIWGEKSVRCCDCAFYGVAPGSPHLGFCAGQKMVRGQWRRTEPNRRANQCHHFEPMTETE